MAYSVTADLEAKFGPDNIDKWSDVGAPSGESAPARVIRLAARVAAAIAFADELINDKLRVSFYTVPLVANGVGYSETVVDLSATYASVWLYESRGIDDFAPDTGQTVHRLIYAKENADKFIQSLLTGSVVFDCEKDSPYSPRL